MKTFYEILSEAQAARPIKSSGAEAPRHTKKYIAPFVKDPDNDEPAKAKPVKNAIRKVASFKSFVNKTKTAKAANDNPDLEYTHKTAKDGHKVAIRKHHVDDKGVTQVSTTPEPKKPGSGVTRAGHGMYKGRASELIKPNSKTQNAGHDYEGDFHKRMQDHGLADKDSGPAGSTGGSDSHINNKKTGKRLNTEVKAGTTAAMGQLTINHTKEKGWHIPDHAREKRPEYAKEIEKAGILDHMNKHHDPDKVETTESGRAKNVSIKHHNMAPAEAYLKDHHVDVLHVGTHGTYRVGDKDATGHGLPQMKGHGKWTVREKQFGNKHARTVMFQPGGRNALEKSHVDLGKDDHLEKFKKSIGH